jgi:peptide/nickel transport system substrate-binding protein
MTVDGKTSDNLKTALSASRRTVLKSAAAIGVLGGLGRLAAEQAAAQESATPTPVSGGTLTAGITGQPDNLDPATNVGYSGVQVYGNVFSKLVDVDERGQLVPQLAKSWKQSGDTVWEFDLVDNAVFHNGEPFTANDVKFTIDRIKDPQIASSFAPLFAPVTTVEVVSDYLVRFTLEKPFGPFLSNLAARGQIVNQKAVTDFDPKRNPIGTGPFKFVEWVSDDHLTLERWDQYFRAGKPYLDQIVFRGLPVDQTRMAALQANEVQWVDAVPLNLIADIKSSSEVSYLTSSNAGLPDYLALNNSKPPFDNVKLRQAVAWATDRKTILQLAYSGIGEVASEAFPSGSPWYSGSDPYANGPDLDMARQLLDESGFDKNQTIEMLSLPQYPELQRTAEIMKDQLEQIGLKIDLKQVEVTIWLNQFINKGYQITTAYQQGILDPDDFYYLTLHGGEPRNFTGYNNPAADRPLEEARFTSDQAKRKELYDQALAIILNDAPVVFTHYELVNYAFQPKAHGVTILPSMDLRFEDVWLEQ